MGVTGKRVGMAWARTSFSYRHIFMCWPILCGKLEFTDIGEAFANIFKHLISGTFMWSKGANI